MDAASFSRIYHVHDRAEMNRNRSECNLLDAGQEETNNTQVEAEMCLGRRGGAGQVCPIYMCFHILPHIQVGAKASGSAQGQVKGLFACRGARGPPYRLLFFCPGLILRPSKGVGMPATRNIRIE